MKPTHHHHGSIDITMLFDKKKVICDYEIMSVEIRHKHISVYHVTNFNKILHGL